DREFIHPYRRFPLAIINGKESVKKASILARKSISKIFAFTTLIKWWGFCLRQGEGFLPRYGTAHAPAHVLPGSFRSAYGSYRQHDSCLFVYFLRCARSRWFRFPSILAPGTKDNHRGSGSFRSRAL